jgi:hypothetical protein
MKHKDKNNLLIAGIFGVLILAIIIGIIADNKVPTGSSVVQYNIPSSVRPGGRQIAGIKIYDSVTPTKYDGIKVCFNLINHNTTSLWNGILEVQLTKQGTTPLSIGTITSHCDASNPSDGHIAFSIMPNSDGGVGCVEFPSSEIGKGVFAVKIFALNGCCVGPTAVDACAMIEPTPSWGGVLVGYGEVSTSACTSHASKRCWTDPAYGDVYWYNSCGVKEEVKTYCNGMGCKEFTNTTTGLADARCVTCESNCLVAGEKICDSTLTSVRTCTQVGDCKQYKDTSCGTYGCVAGTAVAQCKTCVNECSLGDAVCSGNNLITCVSGDCLEPVSTACDYGCSAGACNDAPNGCTPGTQTPCTDPTSGCTGGSKTCLSTRLYGICTTTLSKCSDGVCRDSCASCVTGDRQDCTNLNGCAGVQSCVSGSWASCAKTQDKCLDGTCAAIGQCIGTPADDADKDGISDSYDVCPKTPAGAKVDSKGCSFLQNYWIYFVAGGVLLLIIAGIIILVKSNKPKFYTKYKG